MFAGVFESKFKSLDSLQHKNKKNITREQEKERERSQRKMDSQRKNMVRNVQTGKCRLLVGCCLSQRVGHETQDRDCLYYARIRQGIEEAF